MSLSLHKVIISGGGTGGHIFPAIAIANELRRREPSVQLLFVGAKGKMEMEKVPQAGYEIQGLDIAGLRRKFDLRNLLLPFLVIRSIFQAWRILRAFRPQVAIGVGGFASAPLLFAAQLRGIPTLIQEQNSYAGLTNKILAKRAKVICVAYEGMQKYFPEEKIVKTGNPVRNEMVHIEGKKEEAMNFFGLATAKPVLLVIGGSLGARTINNALKEGIKDISAHCQVIWQTGKFYYDELRSLNNEEIKVHDFIQRMDYAYAAADVIVSRAGALSVAELCLVGKPVILVPSPNVAEDHQTKNARVLEKGDACILVPDKLAVSELPGRINELVSDKVERNKLSENIKTLALPDAVRSITDQIERLIEQA